MEKGNDTPHWGILTDDAGVKLYEGFVVSASPQGAGTAYYPSGVKYQEGIFGFKGLLCGREYYPNGGIRFEGVFRYNAAYGPNYPVYGTFYDENGNKKYEGKFKIWRSGVGYPFVEEPADFGPVPQKDRPRIH